MKSATNSALFTDVSAEESSTLNGGLLGWTQKFTRRKVYDRFGRPTLKWYVRWVPYGTLDIRYLQ